MSGHTPWDQIRHKRPFTAQLKTPGGAFYFTPDSNPEFYWKADDEDAPPYQWGWHNLESAEAYFTEILKVIHAAQEAKRGG